MPLARAPELGASCNSGKDGRDRQTSAAPLRQQAGSEGADPAPALAQPKERRQGTGTASTVPFAHAAPNMGAAFRPVICPILPAGLRRSLDHVGSSGTQSSTAATGHQAWGDSQDYPNPATTSTVAVPLPRKLVGSNEVL